MAQVAFATPLVIDHTESSVEIFNRLLDQRRLKEILALIQLDKRLSPSCRVIWHTLFELLRFNDTRTGAVYYNQIRNITGFSVSTIKRSIKRLISLKYLDASHHLDIKTSRWSSYVFTVLLPDHIYNQMIDLSPSAEVKMSSSLMIKDKDKDKDLRVKNLDYYSPTEIYPMKPAEELKLNSSNENLTEESQNPSEISFAERLSRAKRMSAQEMRENYKKMRAEGEQEALERIRVARAEQKKNIIASMHVETVEFDKNYVSISMTGFEKPFRVENFVLEKIKHLQKTLTHEQVQDLIYAVSSPTGGKTQMHQLNSALLCMRANTWKTPYQLVKARESLRVKPKNLPINQQIQEMIKNAKLIKNIPL